MKYLQFKDEKMLKVLEIDYEKEKVKVDLSKLYLNIDIAETLSNLTGKWIKKISDGEVELEDGMKINLPASRRNQYFIYAILCDNQSIYIGQTDDLIKRWQEHLNGKVSWTSKYKPVEIIHYEVYATREEAVKREKELKTGFGRKWIKRELKAGRLRKWSEDAARQAGTKDLDYKLIKPLIWWE